MNFIPLKYIIFIGFFACQVFGGETNKSGFVSLSCENQDLISVLDEIREQTALEFVYRPDLLEGRKVSCRLSEVPIREALDLLLAASEISYKIMPTQLVVFYPEKPLKQTIWGTVVDSVTNEPLPNANILIHGTNQGLITNDSGSFEFTFENADLCTLMVCYVGYTPALFVADGALPAHDLKIKLRQNSIQVRPLLVTDYKLPQLEFYDKQGEMRLPLRELNFLPTASQGDINQALQLMPGTKSIFDRLNGLYVQGGTPNQNLILFDGIPVIRAEHLWGYLNVFNSDAVDNIRLHKAGYPAKYGSKLSSVVELEGACPEEERLKIKLGSDLIATHFSSTIPLGESAASHFSFRRSIKNSSLRKMYYNVQDHLFLLNRRYLSQVDHEKMFDFFDAAGKIVYKFSPAHKISASVFTTYDKIDITKLDESNKKQEGERYERWVNHGAGLNWTRRFAKSKSHLQFSWSQFENNYLYNYRMFGNLSQSLPDGKVIQNVYNVQVEEKDRYRVELWNFKLEQTFDLRPWYGFDFGMQSLQMNVRHALPGKYVLNLSNPVDEMDEFVVNVPQSSKSWGNSVFMTHEIRIAQKAAFDLGFRTTRYELLNKYFFEPRLGLQVDLKKSLNINAKWGRYHQFLHQMTVKAGDYNPQRTSFTWALASGQLQPESAEHAAFGLNYDWSLYSFNISVYQKANQHLPILLPSIQKVAQEDYSDILNIDRGTSDSKGVELLLWKKYGWFSGWLLYQVGNTHYQFPTINQGRRFLAEFNRTHELNWVGKLTWRNWTSALLWIYATGVPYATADHTVDGIPLEDDFMLYYNRYMLVENQLPNYSRIDFKLAYEKNISKIHIECGFSVFNIFDRKNILDQYYNDMPDFFFDRKSDLTEMGRTVFLFVNVGM